MRPNPWFSADLVPFTEEIFNRKLHFLCNAKCIWPSSFLMWIHSPRTTFLRQYM